MSAKEYEASDKLLRKREVAERLACSLRTVEREANVGRLTRVKVRGGVRFREAKFRKLLPENHDLQSRKAQVSEKWSATAESPLLPTISLRGYAC